MYEEDLSADTVEVTDIDGKQLVKKLAIDIGEVLDEKMRALKVTLLNQTLYNHHDISQQVLCNDLMNY